MLKFFISFFTFSRTPDNRRLVENADVVLDVGVIRKRAIRIGGKVVGIVREYQ